MAARSDPLAVQAVAGETAAVGKEAQVPIAGTFAVTFAVTLDPWGGKLALVGSAAPAVQQRARIFRLHESPVAAVALQLCS